MIKKSLSAMRRYGSAAAGLVHRLSFRAVLKRCALLALGLVLIACAGYTYLLSDSQAQYYNKGRRAYVMASEAGSPGNPIHSSAQMAEVVGQARQAFEQSRMAYQRNLHGSWLRRFLSPQPDAHLAAMAAFQEAKCFLALRQPKLAVKAFQMYLQINPGSSSDEYMEDTLVDQYDLEMLLKANPSAGDGSGQGNGKGDQKGLGQPGKGTPTKI